MEDFKKVLQLQICFLNISEQLLVLPLIFYHISHLMTFWIETMAGGFISL